MKNKTEQTKTVLTYKIILHMGGDKYPSDDMTREQASSWIKKNSRKSFTVTLWINGEWQKDLTKAEIDAL